MRKLLPFLFILFAVPCFGQTWSTMPADYILSMNTSSPGTPLTAGIVAAGFVSSSMTESAGIGTGFTVGQNQGECNNLGPIQMNGSGGALLPLQSQGFNNIGLNDADPGPGNNIQLNSLGSASGKTVVSALICIHEGASSSAGSGSDWDRYGMWASGGGEYAMLQRTQGGGCTTQAAPSGFICYRLEGKPTSHSGYFFLQPQHSYWFAYWWNDSNGTVNGQPAGTMLLHVYTADGTPIACATSTGCTTLSANGSIAADIIPNQTAILTTADHGGGLDHITIGNNENASSAGGTTTYFQDAMFNFTTAPFPLFWTQTDPSALTSSVGGIAPGRTSTWSSAGVSPSIAALDAGRSACGSTLPSTSSTATIDTAIDNCSAGGGGIITLGAGTFSAGFSFRGADNVTVRGQGSSTILAPSSVPPGPGAGGAIVQLDSSDANSARGTISNGSVAVTVTVPIHGANTITLASVPNLKVGNPIILDQLDNQTDIGGVLVEGTPSSYTGTFTAPGSAGPYSTQGSNGYSRGEPCSSPTACFGQQQIVTVTQCDGITTLGHACSSGANITISPGLWMPNWSSSNSMSAWWATNPALNDGVEDLDIDGTNLSSTGGCGNDSGACGVQFFNCQNCWAKGIGSGNTGGEAHFRVVYGNHFSIVNNYAFYNINGASSSYGYEVTSGSDGVIENNIAHGIATPWMNNGPAVNVVYGYNYSINDYYTPSTQYNIPARGDHLSGISYVLTEGNIINGHTADNVHGTTNLNVDFRNQFMGTQPACYLSGSGISTSTYSTCTQILSPEYRLAYHRFDTIIGNVLGGAANSGYTGTTYNTGSGPYPIIVYNGGQTGLGATDSQVSATLALWGNADAVNGFGSPRFNCSELPTAWAGSGNISPWQAGVLYTPCPLTDALPASFYYSSKPSWWPAGKPWPLIGPDISSGNLLLCSGGTQAGALVTTTTASACTSAGGTTSTAYGGLANSNAAMDCYLSLGGLPNGTGPQLTNFSEAACYGGAAPPPTPAPAATMFAKATH